MRKLEVLRAVIAFVQARWLLPSTSRAAIERRQRRLIRKWMKRSLPKTSFYTAFEGRSLTDLPIVDKTVMMLRSKPSTHAPFRSPKHERLRREPKPGCPTRDATT